MKVSWAFFTTPALADMREGNTFFDMTVPWNRATGDQSLGAAQ